MSLPNSPNVPPPPPNAPAKKGMGPLAWVGIGCLVVLVLGMGTCYAVGRYATNKMKSFADNPEMTLAKGIVMANPDLELVTADDAAGKITVKNKKTGEEVTVTVADIREGKLSFEGKDGSSSFSLGGDGMKVTDAQGQETTISIPGGKGDMPDWVPVYSGAEVNKVLSTSNKQQRTGTYILNTEGSLAEVADFYETALKAAGLDTEKSMASVGNELNGAAVSGKSADGKRSINVGVSDLGGKARAIITYVENLQ